MKRILALIISAVLVLTAFTACSKGNTGGKDEGDTSSKALLISVDSHYEQFDESAVNAFNKLCQAIIDGKEQAKFNALQFEKVNQLYYTCFPLSALVESLDLLPDGSGYSIKYKKPIDEHLKLVKDFENTINDIKSKCAYQSVTLDNYIFNVYTYLTANYKADNTVLTPYDALMQKKGYSSAVNALFEYLVLQGGGKACHIIGSAGASFISLVNFNGVWYYFDPYSEIADNQGTALKYFAMSDTALKTTYTYTDSQPVTEKGDGAFDKLENSVSYEVQDKKAIVRLSSGEPFELDLS